MTEENKAFPQEYMSLAECGEKWKMALIKIEQLCEEGKVEGAAKLGKAWIIPIDAEKPIIKSCLSRPVIPKNKLQEAALEHIEAGESFTVDKIKEGDKTFIVSSVFPRQGPTLEELQLSFFTWAIEREMGISLPPEALKKLKAEARRESKAAKETFDDYVRINRENLKTYGFSEEDIEVLLEKIIADYEPFEL